MKTVLFACIQNAGRSQMAAAWFNLFGDPNKARALSAGTRPANQIHPVVIVAMREVGIDMGDAEPQSLTPELARTADLLVTMGCGDACPYVRGLRVEEWALPDPKDQSLEAVRKIRDDIRKRVERLLAEEKFK
jgi:arsenate reductase